MDFDANALTSAIVKTAGVPKKEFAWLTREKSNSGMVFDLKLCNAIPMEKSAGEDPCVTIFQSNESGPMPIPGGLRRREVRSKVYSDE